MRLSQDKSLFIQYTVVMKLLMHKKHHVNSSSCIYIFIHMCLCKNNNQRKRGYWFKRESKMGSITRIGGRGHWRSSSEEKTGGSDILIF